MRQTQSAEGSSIASANGKSSAVRENALRVLFILFACVSMLAVIMICIFIFAGGFPAMAEIGFVKFLTGTLWRPSNDIYGILPMIMGSIYATAGAIIIGVPIGVLTAVYLAWFCPQRIYKVLKPMVELLAGIPSIVYGFFGLTAIVPAIREIFGGSGTSLLAASILLGIMILPTIIGVSESALRAVPYPYYEGAVALGSSHERSVFFVMLPGAGTGVLSGVVLGIGRAIGETMAVIMVAGNQPRMPAGILKGVRTLTTNIVLEMGYAADLHRGALIATAAVLFVFVLIITSTFAAIRRRAYEK